MKWFDILINIEHSDILYQLLQLCALTVFSEERICDLPVRTAHAHIDQLAPHQEGVLPVARARASGEENEGVNVGNGTTFKIIIRNVHTVARSRTLNCL